MRFLRKLVGVGMVMVGSTALLAGGAGWLATGHRDPNGAFTADLAPVRSDGPIVVVPDVAEAVARHRVAGVLAPGPVRVTVASSPWSVLLVVMPADAARRYLDGVARTEVAAVGFASGPQPLSTEDIAGTDTLPPLPRTGVLTSGTDVVFDPFAQPGRLSLLIMRRDQEPGVAASLVVGIRPGWLDPAARGLLVGGGLLLVGGLFALLWRTARELRLVVDAQQLVDLAVAQAAPEPRGARQTVHAALPSSHDPTDEPVPAIEVDGLESISSSIEELEDEMSDVVERDEQSKDGIRGRWGNMLRRRAGGRHVASSTVEHESESSTVDERHPSARDRFEGESPYIYTAT
jgi:hypothetical protein